MSLTPDASESALLSEFPVLERFIYLNHAAVAPWPVRTVERVTQFARENAQCGAAGYPGWLETERRLRTQFAALVNADIDEISLLKNTSEGLSFVAHGLPWCAGDGVVISDEEFPSNRIVWESLSDRGVRVSQVRLHGIADPEAALLAACERDTRLLSVSSVQYASGLRLDLARLGAGCRERGVLFCVDAIQALGAVTQNVEAMHIDFLVADGHKWLLGPEGIAAFYCRAAVRDRLTLHEFGWHMVDEPGNYERRDWKLARDARRFECGSPNMLGIHALSASVALLADIGMDEIERRLLARAQYLLQALAANPEIELLTSAVPGRYAGIVTFRHRRRTVDELMAQLRARNVICAARGGGIRFSPHFYTPFAHLDRALEAIGN